MVHEVLELCCFEWFQNHGLDRSVDHSVLELCCFEWFQNASRFNHAHTVVLELCCFEWFQNRIAWTMAKKQCFRAVLFRMVPKLLGKRRDYDRCVLELCCF